jgi:hypothetical protein
VGIAVKAAESAFAFLAAPDPRMHRNVLAAIRTDVLIPKLQQVVKL